MATEERRLLESWKEISAYTKRSEKTCRRFEETLGMPVHRLDGTPRARVFAYTDELDDWLRNKLNHAEEDAAAAAAEEAAEEARGRARRLRALLIGTAAFVVLAVGAVLIWHPFSTAPGPILPHNPSLAVLPFDNPNKDAGLEPWRSALADLVITDLVQSRYVNVVRITDLARRLFELKLGEVTSFSGEELKAVAAKTGVDYVATGSLARQNGTVVVTIDVRDLRPGHAPRTFLVSYGKETEAFGAADHISRWIKSAIGLRRRQVSRDIDQDVAAISTASAQAFRLYSQGHRLFSIGSSTEAIPLFQRALELDPDFALTCRYLYRACQNLGRVDEGKIYAQKAIDLSPRLSEREKGELEFLFYRDNAKDPKKQRDALERLWRVYPQDRMVCLYLLPIYVGLEDWDKALAVAEGAWPANRSDSSICRQLATCYLNFGWGDKAVSVLSDFIDANRGSPVATAVARYRAKCYLQMDRVDEALAEARRWLAEAPDNIVGILDAGLIQLRKEDFPAARREFEKVLARNEPRYQLDALAYMRDMFLMQGKVGEAKAQLRRALEIAAGVAGERALAMRPMKGGLHLELSYLHRLTGDFDEALGEIEAARALGSSDSPPPVRLLCDKAIVLLDLNRTDDFAKVAEQIKAQIEEGQKPKMMRIYHYLMGRRELAKGDPEKAVKHLWRAVDLMSVPGPAPDGADPEYFYYLAEAMRVSHSRNFRGMYEKVTLPTIDHFHNGDLYAMSIYRQAEFHDSRAEGSVLVRSDDLGQAAGYYRKFLALWGEADPPFAPLVENARARLRAIEKLLASS